MQKNNQTTNKYISKYSNNKKVSAAQYITEMVCERKAIKDKKDLHYRFWTNKFWQSFYRNQIASANKLLARFSDKAIINALNTDKGKNIYSLRAPHLTAIIEQEEKTLSAKNTKLTKQFDRNDTVRFKPQTKNKNNNLISKLKDLDNES